jgi:molybdenum cofactor guanylyltransferase
MKTSAVVLAGGESRRMRADKAGLTLGGRTLLARTVATLAGITDDIIVVGRTAARGHDQGVRVVPDDVPNVGPLGGLLTGLRRIRHPHAIVVACDLPFLNAALLRYLASLANEFDAVVPEVGGHMQTAHAVYAGSLCPVIETQLSSDSRSLRLLLSTVRVRWVAEPEMNRIDPALQSFVNVNTPDEWSALQTSDAAGVRP